jgi:hypothetical protein
MHLDRALPGIVVGILACAIFASLAQGAFQGNEKTAVRGGEGSGTEELQKFFEKAWPAGRARQLAKADLPMVLRRPLRETPTDSDLRKLLNARYNAMLALTANDYVGLTGDRIHDILPHSRLFMIAGLEAAETPRAKIEFLNQMMEFCARLAMKSENLEGNMEGSKPYSRAELRPFALEVNIELLKAQKAAKAEK